MRRLSLTLLLGAALGVAWAIGCSGGGNGKTDGGDGGIDLSVTDRPLGAFTRCLPATAPKVLSNLPGSHRAPRIAFTGSRFVVAWNTSVTMGADTRYRVDGAVTDLFGNNQGPNIPMTAQPVADPGPPTVTPLLTGTSVAWIRKDWANGATNVFLNTLDATGQRLDASGQPCDPGNDSCGQFQVTTSDTATEPFLARPQLEQHTAKPTENQVGLVWVDSRNYAASNPSFGFNDIYWKKISASGETLVPDRPITTAGANRRNAFPRLAFDGVNQGVVWRDGTDGDVSSAFLFGALNTLGQVSAAPRQVGTGSGAIAFNNAPDLVWTGSDYGLVVSSGSEASASIVFQRIGSNGASVLDPIGVTFSDVSCTPAIAWDGDYFAVVWQMNCGQPGANLAFELVDSQGVRMGSDGKSCGGSLDPMCGVHVLNNNTGSAFSTAPELAWAGGHAFGLVWQQGQMNDASTVTSSEVNFVRIECTSP